MITKEHLGSLAYLKSSIKNFETTQTQFSNVGAADTEPDLVFQLLLNAAFNEQNPELPEDGRGWQLYTPETAEEETLVDAAVTALNASANLCVLCITHTTIANRENLRSFLKEYCWRL